MHEKYEKMRSSIAALSRRIMNLELEDHNEERATKLKMRRDNLYTAAVNLKCRYDTIFGAIEPVSVVQLSEDKLTRTEYAPGHANHGEILYCENGECFSKELVPEQGPFAQRCRSEGSPPDTLETYKVSFARDMASKCVLGSAEATLDCCIGNARYTGCNDQLGEEVSASDEQTPTEGRDANEEMVNAIVQDLTAFLKAECGL
jgi:hypothetical protein